MFLRSLHASHAREDMVGRSAYHDLMGTHGQIYDNLPPLAKAEFDASAFDHFNGVYLASAAADVEHLREKIELLQTRHQEEMLQYGLT